MFIENVMKFTNNFFMVWKSSRVFEVILSKIVLTENIPQGVYVMIHGSLYNDGIYENIAEEVLIDETFAGTIIVLAPNRAFKDLCEEIEQYSIANPMTAITSETVPNYSKTLARDKNNEQGWEVTYRKRLLPFMKIPKDMNLRIMEVADYGS